MHVWSVLTFGCKSICRLTLSCNVTNDDDGDDDEDGNDDDSVNSGDDESDANFDDEDDVDGGESDDDGRTATAVTDWQLLDFCLFTWGDDWRDAACK
jgi:hypothetical protein